MPDREKVVKGLECLANETAAGCYTDCPYYENHNSAVCFQAMARDALAMLREREAPTVATDINVLGKWISVKDRLPEPPAQCLVYSAKASRPRGMETATYTEFGWMMAAYFPDITHWMLLPEPPEDDAEEEHDE